MDIPKKIIRFLFLLFQAIQAANDCPTGFCGRNPLVIRFPFRFQDVQPEHCGYPGFDLSCTIQRRDVILSLPYSGEYGVREINYAMQEIILYDPNNCLPWRVMSLNLSFSPFMASYYQNFTFLSCPPDVVRRTRLATIDCLSNSTASVLATSSMSVVRGLNSCSVIGTFPVPVSWPQGDESFSSSLDDDLRLVWDVSTCGDCELRGGVCGFQNSTSNSIFCFDGARKGPSPGLQIFKIIVLSIVIPAITCSVCISCFICMVERRGNRGSTRDSAIAAAEMTSVSALRAGLDDSTIESYTKVVIGESRRLPGPNGATCPICLVDYHPNDTIRCIPECEHCFHSDCIDEWLRMNSTCPVCRKSPSPERANA